MLFLFNLLDVSEFLTHVMFTKF